MVCKSALRRLKETALRSRAGASRLLASLGAVGEAGVRRAGVVGVVVLVGAVLWSVSPVWGQSAAAPVRCF